MDLSFISSKSEKSKSYTRPNSRKDKPAESVQEDDDGHMVNLSSVKAGTTIKQGNYGYAGYKFLKNLTDNESAGISADAYVERKSIYENFEFVDRAYESNIADLIKTNFKFESGPEGNFCSSAKGDDGALAGKKFPYRWQAHHILPQEVYRGKKAKNRVFNDEQAELIEATGYSINHGHNIIFLPGSGAAKFVAVHGLAQHVGSHPNYSKLVFKTVNKLKGQLVSEFDKIKKELKEAENNEHKSVKTPILKDLRAAEQTMWEEIVDASSESIESLLEGGGDISKIMTKRSSWFKLG